MSMTKEEIIKKYEMVVEGGELVVPFMGEDVKEVYEMLKAGLSALRPITREQVERVWRGEWEEERFAGEHEGWQHRECGRHSTEKTKWCPKCGKAMTDEAVEIVMERLEVLGYGKDD